MINWKRVAFLSGLFLLLLLLARGCIHSCSIKNEPSRKREIVLPQPISDRRISVFLDEQNKTAQMNLEEYLVGVVAAEMPSSFHEQALRAQAVAARTYTMRTIEKGGCKSGADICTDSSCCQAYDDEAACKKKWGGSFEANIQKVRSSVNATQGEAIYYDGHLIDALYHAASGGYTEDSENVFASRQPYLRSVKSSNEIGSSHITDEKKFSKSNFVKTVNAAFQKANLKASTLREQVKIKETYASGRVKSVTLGGTTATGRELRNALGLRSAWFEIEFRGEDVVIKTRGFGHGVGMSQAGANGMAEEGADYKEILAHYYTGTSLAG